MLTHFTNIECFDLLGVLWSHERPRLGRMDIAVSSHLSSIAIDGYETVGLRPYFLHRAILKSTSNLLERRLAIAWCSLICITCIAVVVLGHFYQFLLLNVQIHSVLHSGWRWRSRADHHWRLISSVVGICRFVATHFVPICLF